MKRRDRPAAALPEAVFDRQHDRRPVERVDELRRDDADDAAMPAVAGDDEDERAPTSGSVWTIFFACGEDLGFFLLPPHVLAVELQRQRRASSASASSAASSSRVAMSGVLMRPAALTRGASMKPM